MLERRLVVAPRASEQDPPTRAPTRARYTAVAFTLALIGVAYLDRVCIATAAPVIKRDLALSDAAMGLVFSAFTFAYALFEVPSGWLADRFGARVTLTRIVVWWSMMTAATGLAGGLLSLVLIRLLFGAGEAGTFPATARVYARWLPRAERGRMFGLAIMTGALAGAATQPLVVALLARMSWRHVFAIFGSVGILWALAWWWWFRDDPRQHAKVNEAEYRLMAAGGAETRHRGAPPWGKLVRNRTMLALCCMYGGVIYGWYFYLTWLPTYLLRARGFDLKQAGWLAALAVLGAVGTPDPMRAALLLAAAAGLAALGVAPAWAVCLEIGGVHAGVVSGAMNTLGNLGGAASPIVVGIALDRWNSWQAPLVSVAALYVVSALCWLAIDPAQRIETAEVRR